MKIIIHIGYTKTGTTSIQSALYKNRDILEKHNCYYPNCGIVNNHHFYLAHNIIGPISSYYNPSKGNLEDLIEEINKLPQDATVVISCETMIRYQEKTIAKLQEGLNGHDVKIVAYLRRQDLWLNSQFVQVKKNIPLVAKNKVKRAAFKITVGNLGNIISQSFEDFCTSPKAKRPSGDYFKVLESWAKFFGRDNIIARVFERELLKDNNAVSDFFDIIGVPVDLIRPESRANTSPDWKSCMAALNLMNYANKVGKPSNNWAASIAAKALYSSDQVQLWNEKSEGFLTQEFSQKLLKKYEKSNQLLSETYLKGESSFSGKVIENKTPRNLENIPTKEFVDALGSSLIKVSEDLVKARNNVKKLKKNIVALKASKIKEIKDLKMQLAKLQKKNAK